MKSRKTACPTGLELARISPRLGAKYSPNLFAYLASRHTTMTASHARVFLDRDGRQWLGFSDDLGAFVGQRLSQVLSFGSSLETLSFDGLGPLKEHVGFWEEYIADGRCAIDRAHRIAFIGSQTRWQSQGTRRHCLWCGKARQVLARGADGRQSWQTTEDQAVTVDNYGRKRLNAVV